MGRVVPRLICVALLAACSPNFASFAEKHSTSSERAFGLHYIELASRTDLDSASSLLTPELRSDSGLARLHQVSGLLRSVRRDSLHLIGFSFVDYIPAGHREVNLNYEGPTTNGTWLTVYVATRSQGNRVVVTALSVTPINGPLEVLNAFSLAGKGLRQYLWLVFLIIVPVFCVTVAVVVARTKGMPRRWLWTLAALVASPTFMLNWTSGAAAIRNSLFILLGAAATKAGPAAPWLLSVAVPTGALVALIRRQAWLRSAGRSGAESGGPVAG